MHLIPVDIASYCFSFVTQGILPLQTIKIIFFLWQCLGPVSDHYKQSTSLCVLQLTNLTEIHDQISGMARCPYNPLHNSTALITSSGELYAATAMDFSGRDPAIYRSLGGLPPLRTAQYNSKWLNGRELPCS